MDEKERAFLERLLATFVIEAGEHLEAIGAGLAQMDKAATRDEMMRAVEMSFREAHSLKGAARAVDQGEIESLCQSMESWFASLKRGDREPTPADFERFWTALSRLQQSVAHLGLTSAPPRADQAPARIACSTVTLEAGAQPAGAQPASAQPAGVQPAGAQPGAVPVAVAQPVPEAHGSPALSPSASLSHAGSEDTVRLPGARMLRLLLQMEEMAGHKPVAQQQVTELRQLGERLEQWRQEKRRTRVRVRQESTNEGQRADADEWTEALVADLEGRVRKLVRDAERDRRHWGAMLDASLGELRTSLMLPASTLLEQLTRAVADLAHGQGKEATFFVRGEALQLDRRILQEMKDPLLHLVRNAIDHGIEDPSVRERAGKRRSGVVTVTVSARDAATVQILVEDDGAGIDPAQVGQAALRAGVVTQAELGAMLDSEVVHLVFGSGVSSREQPTELSGRGLGLAIVREKVERLGGSVTIETRRAEGTSFRILLPTLLATLRGILVRAHGHLLVLPVADVERVGRVRRADIKTVEGHDTVVWGGRVLSLARLGDVLAIRRPLTTEPDPETAVFVVVTVGERTVGFAVDEVLLEQELISKSLGKQLSRVRNVAGATVLGTGEVVPILNCQDLLESAAGQGRRQVETTDPAPSRSRARRRVLVADDSITSRTLLRNIIESAGYLVRTAVDGVEAFALLRTEEFDLVVTDVDMPRLNGFDLTARIRADRRLAHLPVVIVSALEAREERERGIDVGASAYLVKSSFDQSNLIEVMARFL